MTIKKSTRVLSFANQKGGGGKSTLLLQMAHYLRAHHPDYKILAIDFDPQGNTSTRLSQQINFDSDEAKMLFSKGHTPKPFESPYGLDLIGTRTNNASFYEVEKLELSDALNPKNNLKPVMGNYDFVLIDCPPSLGNKLFAALAMSTHVVCPVQLSGFALEGIYGVIDTIKFAQTTSNPNLKLIGVLVNAMNSRSKSHATSLEEFKEVAPNLVLSTIIHNRASIDEATTLGLPIQRVARKKDKAIVEIEAAMALILTEMGGTSDEEK